MPAENFPKMVPERFKKYRSGRHATELYISPHGSDKWSGTLPGPDEYGSDGPFATVRRVVKQLAEHPTPGPVTVRLRGGRYEIEEPLVFGPDASGPVTFAAYEGEEVVLDGGRRITGWREDELNGREVWRADLSALREHDCYFRQLFVNGQRRRRPTLPKSGFFRMADVPNTPLEGFRGGTISDRFYAAEGDIQPWRNITDVDVVAYHYWNEERMPIVSFDPASREVRCGRVSVWPLKDDAAPQYARYRVENVKEALTEPGEWYLDRGESAVYYMPMQGEMLGEVEITVPRVSQLLTVRGDRETGRPVTGLAFRGLTFRNTSWHQPGDRAGHEQASRNVPAVVSFDFARHCSIRDCTIENIGFYGIEIGPGCRAIAVTGNTIRDMGAGGVKCVGGGCDDPVALRTGDNIIADNEISDGGHVFASAVGVLLVHAFSNDVVHNHIHHLEYSGISCGWVWGYGDNATRDNLISKNHIHHLGTGMLNDMGGIYTLGVQPGTVIRNNLIHDVRMHNYGGWAIYADEGSSYLVIEKNVCFNTDSELLQLHYGRENVVRNNIFAFSVLGHVSLNVVDPEHSAFTFLRNIVISDGKPVFLARNRESLDRIGFVSDLNVLWDVSGEPVYSANQFRDAQNQVVNSKVYTVEQMRALGYDRHSVVADPRCADAQGGDFTLGADSPAFDLGFEPIDLSDVGPRGSGSSTPIPS